MTTIPSSKNMQHLARLSQKLRTDKAYMASLLATYQAQENLADIELANILSINITQVPRLALCKRPISEDRNFAEQVRQIASYTGANETTLAQIIKQVDILEKFHALSSTEITETEKRSVAPSSGILAAARDKEDEDNKPTSDDEPNDK